jgi:hypothetical protein
MNVAVMRSQGWRRSVRVVAGLLLLATLTGLLHLADDDTACLQPTLQQYEQHDQSAHSVRADSVDARKHCALCHWNRVARSLRAPVILAVAHVVPFLRVHHFAGAEPTAPVLENLAARAPPSTLL